MNSEWKSFLQEQGANFNEQGSIEDFGNPELEHFLVKHGPILADLSHQALIKVTGEETATFLQGQFSNDLNDVTDTKGQLTAYCEPQGKVLALITVFKQANAYYLSFDGSLKDKIMQRLTMFKLRSKVELEDVSEQMIQIGYAGEFADLDLQRALSTKIKDTYQVECISKKGLEGVIGIKLPGPYHRYSLFGDIETIKQIWNTLSGNSESVGQNDWALLNIVSGQPEVTESTSNEFIAQFLNLDKLEAINFKKGCFPGQEIIARMHYRGKATKRMVRLHINQPLTLTSGDELVLQDDAERSFKFAIVSKGHDIYEGSVALAVTTLKPLESAQGNLKTAEGSIATIEPMPYDLAEE